MFLTAGSAGMGRETPLHGMREGAGTERAGG